MPWPSKDPDDYRGDGAGVPARVEAGLPRAVGGAVLVVAVVSTVVIGITRGWSWELFVFLGVLLSLFDLVARLGILGHARWTSRRARRDAGRHPSGLS